MSKPASKSKIEVGQTLYVNVRQHYAVNDQPRLDEYVVSKVNSSSVYISKGDGRDIRLDKKTLSHGDGWLFNYQAYLTPEEYWNPIKKREEKIKILDELSLIFHNMSLEELKSVKEQYSSRH